MEVADRKTDYVTVPASAPWAGRDAGKTFFIREWYAKRAERWAWGMVFALKGTTSAIPLDVARLGMAGVGVHLINTILAADVPYSAIEPFMNELIDECVQIARDPNNIDKQTNKPFVSPLLENDIAEIATRQWLRSEVIRVHTNFSLFASLSALVEQIRSWRPEPSTTQTSPPSSGEPSPSTPG